MAQARLSVRKVREILRLHHEQALPARQIAAGVGCALSTVQECLRRAAAAGVGWPLPAPWNEAALQTRLYPPTRPVADYPLPDFAKVHAELARKGVTRWLLCARVQSHSPGWTSVHGLLQSLPAVARDPGRGAAPSACAR